MAWKGPRDPKTLLTCKIHTDKSYCPTLGPFWYPRGPKRARFGPKSPFGGPGGPWAALGGLISAQLPLNGVTGLDSWLPHTLTWYGGFLLRPRAPKVPFLAQNASFWISNGVPTSPITTVQQDSAGWDAKWTMTYWAYISAARAPKGLFGPESFSFVAPLWAEFHFGRTIGIWAPHFGCPERRNGTPSS